VISAESTLVPLKKETGADRTVAITALKTRDEKRLSETEIFGDTADLVIAIDVMGNTHGHTYLLINGTRVDGRMFYSPHTEVEKDWTISNGLIIRYKNLPPENREALLKWLASDEVLHTATCVEAACKILYEKAGLSNAPRKNFWFPSKLLAHLANRGITGADGKRVYPEIYTINRDARTVWDNLPNWKAVPKFIFKVFFDPYTWQGFFKKKKGTLETAR
jgi:hypothetical protein